MNIDEVVNRLVGDAQLVEDLKFQIPHLQHRLRIYEGEQATEDRDVEDHDEEENLFHQDDSDDDTPPHPQGVARKNHHDRRGEREDRVRFNPKVKILDFEGMMQSEEFVDWLNIVERIFENGDALENKKVKLVAIKLKKHASLWWENLMRQRE